MDRGCFLAWVSRGRACKLGCERNEEHLKYRMQGDTRRMWAEIVARKSGVMGAWWDLGHRSFHRGEIFRGCVPIEECTYNFLLNAIIGHI